MKSDPLEIAKQLRNSSKTIFPNKKIMLRAADLLEQLHDECTSAWDMLDELKKSDIKNFDNVFKAMKIECQNNSLDGDEVTMLNCSREVISGVGKAAINM